MRRLIIIVEGDTEKEFVDKILFPFLSQNGIHVISCYKITKTGGGLTNYEHLRKDLLKAVYEDNVLVTTLVDFYALPSNFPKYEEAKEIIDKNDRLTFLENAIIEDIQGKHYLPHFLPYIQLHEFEALTFTSINGFQNYFSEEEADFDGLKKVINTFENPEDINESKESAPSKRLKNLVPSYNKIVDGNGIISANGIDLVLQKCVRFHSWIERIIEKVAH